jgi:hypothetical protein
MEPALTLREAFAGLAGTGSAAEPPAGHEGLPEDLLIRAIGSYADTAPAEVAEHLSAFVAAPTGIEAGLHLLAAAPAEVPEGEVDLAGIHEPSDGELSDVHNQWDFHALGNADSLDSLDHAPIAQPAVEQHAAPEVAHDSDFGHRAPVSQEHEAEDLTDQADVGHVPLEDLSHEILADEAGFEADHAPAASDEPEPEHHHGDDGHHDPGLDHFAG